MTARGASSRSSGSAASAPFQAAAVVTGVVAMAVASRLAIPLPHGLPANLSVPITLQTFALFVLAGVFGGRLALFAVLAWLALAAVGAPVLADGAGGWRALTGKSAGFLVGMAFAAYATGEAAAKAKGWVGLTLVFLAGHAIVLAAGWAGLAVHMSPAAAFHGGVLPFLPGAVVKSLAAALAVTAVRR